MTGVLSFSDLTGGDTIAQILHWRGQVHFRRSTDDKNYSNIVLAEDGLYYATVVDGVQSSFKISPPMPPQELPLPLAVGISETVFNGYHKNPFSEVTVNVSVSGTIVDGQAIATLPVGYRPTRPVRISATGSTDSYAIAGLCIIDTNGTITAYCGTVDKVDCGKTFIAAEASPIT